MRSVIRCSMALGMGIALATAGIAVAASDARIEVTAFTGSGATSKSVGCPKGRRATGGGFFPNPAGPVTTLVEGLGPVDSSGIAANTEDGDIAKRWLTRVNGGGGKFKVAAICATSKATIESTDFSVSGFGASSLGQTSVHCGIGRRALGGGVLKTGGDGHVSVLASGPLDGSGVTLESNTGDQPKQWYVAVTSESSATTYLRAFAICGAEKATLATTEFTLPPLTDGIGGAACPKGKRALGGGLVQAGGTPHPANYLRWSGPFDGAGNAATTGDGDVPRRWRAAVSNSAFSESWTFRVFAVCVAS